MGGSGLLGSFEELVLLAVARAKEDGYGVALRRRLAEATGTDVSMGAVHATLERLEAKTLIESEHRKAGSGPGRPRRYFRITSLGRDELAHANRVRARMDQMPAADVPSQGTADA